MKEEKGNRPHRRLSKKEKAILDNLDRILAGDSPLPGASYVEEKIMQVVNSFAYKEEKQSLQQEKVSGIIGDISHQVKTPLSALSLQLELALDEALTPEERRSAIENCRVQADKIKFLTDGVVKIARLESRLIEVRPQAADIVPTIMEAADTVRPSAQRKCLEFIVGEMSECTVKHDTLWTKEALINILDNAVKYTESGSITVTLNLGAVYTTVSVADTGRAIDSKEYAQVFQRFYRGRQEGTEYIEGTGLGLSIAREIMRQQGGNITAAGGHGGNVFTLYFPAVG